MHGYSVWQPLIDASTSIRMNHKQDGISTAGPAINLPDKHGSGSTAGAASIGSDTCVARSVLLVPARTLRTHSQQLSVSQWQTPPRTGGVDTISMVPVSTQPPSPLSLDPAIHPAIGYKSLK
jgi:hypothetical protein